MLRKTKRAGFFRRLKRKIRRLIYRYGYNPAKAIYHEALRHRYVKLGMRLARRKAPKPAIAAARDITPIVQAQQSGPLTPVRPPVLGIRQRAQLRQMSGEHFFAPFRRIELLPDDSWLNSDPLTQPGIVEATAKYESLPKEALPKFLREG